MTVVIIAYVMLTQEYSKKKKKKETEMTPRNDYDILV